MTTFAIIISLLTSIVGGIMSFYIVKVIDYIVHKCKNNRHKLK